RGGAGGSLARRAGGPLRGPRAPAGGRPLSCALTRLYRATPALFRIDGEPAGFAWLGADDASSNLLSFVRFDGEGGSLVAACNLSPVPRQAVRVGLPRPGGWRAVLNTDAAAYGAPNTGDAAGLAPADRPRPRPR